MTEDPEYLIIILLEDVDMQRVPEELKMFLRTHTYINGSDYDVPTLRKRIRFSMPHEPLAKNHPQVRHPCFVDPELLFPRIKNN